MTELNILEVCRLCLGGESLGELTQHLSHIISSCFSLNITASLEVTNRICQMCVDQLINMYKYRKKIIRNQFILLKKLSENVNNCSEKLFLEKLHNHPEFEEVNSDVIDIANDRTDSSEMNGIGTTEFTLETEKQKKNTIPVIEEATAEQKEVTQYPERDIEGIFKDFKVSIKHLDNLKVIETNNSDESCSLHCDIKLSNPDIIKEGNKELTINKISLEQSEISTMHPITSESANDNDSTIETDKENTDKNILNSNDCTDNEMDSKFKEQDRKADVIQSRDQIYMTNMEKKFMCLTCLKVFESQKELSVHYKTVELPKGLKQTAKKFKDSDMVEVSKDNDGKTVFKCEICSKEFENKTSALKHARVHKVERPFLCNLCSRTYKTVDDIIRHGVVHNGNQFVCSYHCGYATVHLGALREHVKRHKKEFKYKCDKCGKCFQVKTWYDQHQNVHDKVRPFVCKLCGQAFSMARYLTAHRANVHPQSSKVKRYKCVQCALPCDSRNALVLHMKQKHGVKTDCLCDVCGQMLPDPHRLSLHRSVHDATRKYSCRFCKKTFNKKDHQAVHEKIHTGERLGCQLCPKSFTQRCSLRRHIKRYHQDHQPLEQKS